MAEELTISLTQKILAIGQNLADACDRLRFSSLVDCVYNPLIYAARPWRIYIERFVKPGTVLMLGMNPGPFGMAQTGVPFGDIPSVRDWMGIQAEVDQPPRVHPKRPIQGFNCRRVEGSGKRLWGYFSSLYPDPQDFFQRCSVLNYCPLVFMDANGANLTPDKLARPDREKLLAICDHALKEIVTILQPRALVGIGAFARLCLDRVVLSAAEPLATLPRLTITHPSPANPRANRGWDADVQASLAAAGLWPL